jgi:hypothetical protein
MNILKRNKIILAIILMLNTHCKANQTLRDFYSDALWYSNKGLKAIHHVGDLMEGNPKLLSIIKKCHKNCFCMHQYIKNDATARDIFLITTGLATATALGFYINYKIIHKVSEKIVGCDGSCKKKKDNLPNTTNSNI